MLDNDNDQTTAASEPATEPASSAGDGGGNEEQVRQLTAQTERLGREMAQSQQALTTLQGKFDKEHQALASTQGQLQQAVEARQKAEAELKTANGQVDSLNNQLDGANSALTERQEQLNRQIADLTEERDTLLLNGERDALLMSEFPALIPFEFGDGNERNGILANVQADDVDGLREAFQRFSATLESQRLQREREILDGVPGAERQTPGSSNAPQTVPDIMQAMDEASRKGEMGEFNRLSELLIAARHGET